MSLFPKIQSACPYRNDFAAIMDGDQCRLCKRQVVDLTAMSDGERTAFLGACEEEVCVSYALPIRRTMRAAAVAAAIAIPAAAAAQDEIMIVVGSITDPNNVTMVQVPEDAAIPELPILYEDEEAAPGSAGAAGPSPAAPPARR